MVKLLAKELHVPVIALSQLKRDAEIRNIKGKENQGGGEPVLSDLRESGAIEQDADIVLMLHRESYYQNDKNEENESDINKAEVIVAKNRHGSCDNVKMGWIGQFTKFRSLEEDRK